VAAALDTQDGLGQPVGPDLLDNAVWHSLRGPHRPFAEEADGPATRFDPDVSVFAALPDDVDDDAWRALASLITDGNPAVLFRHHVEVPEGWKVTMAFPGVQYLGDAVAGRRSSRAEPLGPADLTEMTALVERTRPGPWRPRTVELGNYVGIRDDGRLVAMAGERLLLPGRREISAVCTDEEHRGRGLAGELVEHLVAGARAEGSETFLHTGADNAPARALYDRLGFTIRQDITAWALRPDASAVRTGDR
jgi:ribosomal protein S18 acetylase RimI-like enzyme